MAELEKKAEAATTSPPISSIASEDRDENYAFYRQNRGLEYTPEEEKRTLRKIDLQLIPLLFVIYMIQVSSVPYDALVQYTSARLGWMY
jgi:hypothetical protein